ncbi:MAG: MBL fold metallo-hydrolase, partial [Eubacterium sp.]|nr:MBL fold metallo-hydrolase [Eubacterium sp.]
MKNKRVISIIIALIVFAVFGAGSYLFGDEILDSQNINSNLQTENTIVVNYLDVGQGDSEFIQLPNGKCMLIDASTSNYGTAIANRITALGYTKIDYLVATHPH